MICMIQQISIYILCYLFICLLIGSILFLIWKILCKKMEEKGFITGYHAQIDPVALGYHIKALINLEVVPEDKKEFYPFAKACPNVIECNCVTGDYSMVLEVLFPSTVELDQFIGELQRFGRTKTLIVFSTSVEHRGITAEVREDQESGSSTLL